MSEEIRLMLLDDHAATRQPLALVLGQQPDIRVVAEAASLAEARAALQQADLAVDVAMVDLDLGDGLGADFIREMYEVWPRTQVMVLSAHSERGWLARAIEAGASGVLHKSAGFEEIAAAVRRLHAGEQLVSQREIIDAAHYIGQEAHREQQSETRMGKLTHREREMLQALAGGLSDREISERLHVGEGTVRTHMMHLFAKLEVQSRLQALVFAIRHDLVDIE